MRSALNKPVTMQRGMIARGLAAGKDAVERDGGRYGAGLVRNFAVVTRGEALGHGMWLDQQFVQQTRVALQSLKKGAKSRFTHPGLSADGLAKFLGRAYRANGSGTDVVRSDLHLAKSAHASPDGNLAQYVMDRAAEDPESFGASIVYDIDHQAEREHFEAHGGRIVEHPDGFIEWDAREFKSPDPQNHKNLPHARLKRLRAVDIVDDPAANPAGMFGRDPVFADAERLFSYALGVSEERPTLREFDLDPERIKVFAVKFLDRHGLAITTKEKDAAMANSQPATPPAAATPEQLGNATPQTTPEQKPAADPQAEFAAKHAKYVEAFGAENGNKWLAEGKAFDECQQLHAKAEQDRRAAELAAKDAEIAQLTAERDALQGRIEAAKLGEEKPVGFSPDGEAAKPATKATGGLTAGQAQYAAAIKMPKAA